MDIATRWLDGLVSKDKNVTNEIYSLQTVEFDRQVLDLLHPYFFSLLFFSCQWCATLTHFCNVLSCLRFCVCVCEREIINIKRKCQKEVKTPIQGKLTGKKKKKNTSTGL